MPSIQQLRYLVSLSETRHFRRAADACNVTQPTLSAQFKELERKLGVTLVERSRSKVIMTPTGMAVARIARRILRDLEEIRAVSASGRATLESTIRIGVVPTLGSYFLPLIVPDLHGRYPRLGLYVREGLPRRMLRELQDGSLDLLFYPMPLGSNDLDGVSLFREPIHVALPVDHPLASETAIRQDMLAGETILALEPDHKLYDQVRAICEDVGAELSHDYEGTSLDTLRQMVAMGMGISMLPALYVKSEVAREKLVVARPFARRAPSRTIGMFWRRGTAREDEYRRLAVDICEILKQTAPEVMVLG